MAGLVMDDSRPDRVRYGCIIFKLHGIDRASLGHGTHRVHVSEHVGQRGLRADHLGVPSGLHPDDLAAPAVQIVDDRPHEGLRRDDLDRHPLIVYARSHENLIITPHVGGVTYESQAMAYQAAAEKLVTWFRHAGAPGND